MVVDDPCAVKHDAEEAMTGYHPSIRYPHGDEGEI